jgi:hypothetical protein
MSDFLIFCDKIFYFPLFLKHHIPLQLFILQVSKILDSGWNNFKRLKHSLPQPVPGFDDASVVVLEPFVKATCSLYSLSLTMAPRL